MWSVQERAFGGEAVGAVLRRDLGERDRWARFAIGAFDVAIDDRQ